MFYLCFPLFLSVFVPLLCCSTSVCFGVGSFLFFVFATSTSIPCVSVFVLLWLQIQLPVVITGKRRRKAFAMIHAHSHATDATVLSRNTSCHFLPRNSFQVFIRPRKRCFSPAGPAVYGKSGRAGRRAFPSPGGGSGLQKNHTKIGGKRPCQSAGGMKACFGLDFAYFSPVSGGSNPSKSTSIL